MQSQVILLKFLKHGKTQRPANQMRRLRKLQNVTKNQGKLMHYIVYLLVLVMEVNKDHYIVMQRSFYKGIY